MPPYQEQFSVGSVVRIAARDTLEAFQETWHLHNPFKSDQLSFAGKSAVVKSVGFYHGGDVLYQLTDVPGVWHEVCLEASA
jgi:hypothetical protein